MRPRAGVEGVSPLFVTSLQWLNLSITIPSGPSITPTVPRIPYRALWEKILENNSRRLQELLGHHTMAKFLNDRISYDFLYEGVISVFNDARKPFEDFLAEMYEFRGDLLNRVGAGAETGKLGGLIAEIKEVIWYVNELEMFAMEQGRVGYLEGWMGGSLSYQVLADKE